MQNKPNFLESQMNVSPVITKDYEKNTLGELGKNKPNSNPIKANTEPIKPNFRKAKMNTTACITRPYEVLPPRPRREYKPNQTQFQTRHLPTDRLRPKLFNSSKNSLTVRPNSLKCLFLSRVRNLYEEFYGKKRTA